MQAVVWAGSAEHQSGPGNRDPQASRATTPQWAPVVESSEPLTLQKRAREKAPCWAGRSSEGEGNAESGNVVRMAPDTHKGGPRSACWAAAERRTAKR